MLIATNGKMLTYGKRFSYKDFDIISAVVDVDLTRWYRRKPRHNLPQLPAVIFLVIHGASYFMLIVFL
jgi:hypothetical protein